MRIAVAVMAALTLVLAGVAQATDSEPHKAFVCKYVGTPGVDETLQTGMNPISVDFASLDAIPAIGVFFADAQGRSVVIAIDVGQPEPPVSDCPSPEGPPTPHLFAAETVCNATTGEYDVTGRVDGLLALVSLLHIAGNVTGDTVITVTLGELVGQATVTTAGDCVITPPPPPPPPPTQVTGTARVICDLGAQLYRVFGTIDGNAADLVTPSTFPGTTKGIVEVVVKRGDTSFRTTVTLLGDCAPPTTVTPPPVSVTVPVTPPATAKPPAAKPPVTVKPKPKPKPKAKPKPKPKKPTKHVCLPLKNGTKRVWSQGMCHTVKPPAPSHLTG